MFIALLPLYQLIGVKEYNTTISDLNVLKNLFKLHKKTQYLNNKKLQCVSFVPYKESIRSSCHLLNTPKTHI